MLYLSTSFPAQKKSPEDGVEYICQDIFFTFMHLVLKKIGIFPCYWYYSPGYLVSSLKQPGIISLFFRHKDIFKHQRKSMFLYSPSQFSLHAGSYTHTICLFQPLAANNGFRPSHVRAILWRQSLFSHLIYTD